MSCLRRPVRLLGLLWSGLLAACATGPQPPAPVEAPAEAPSAAPAAEPAQTAPALEPALDAELSLGLPGEPEGGEAPSLLEPLAAISSRSSGHSIVRRPSSPLKFMPNA